MVRSFYFNKKLIYRFKDKGFNNLKINIQDYYGIILKFPDEKSRDKYIIKNSRDFKISTRKVKYIQLKENLFYLYISDYIKKFKYSLFFDYTIPLNFLLWNYLDSNDWEDEYITFSSGKNNIIFEKVENDYLYGLYSDDVYGKNIVVDEKLIIEAIKSLRGKYYV